MKETSKVIINKVEKLYINGNSSEKQGFMATQEEVELLKQLRAGKEKNPDIQGYTIHAIPKGATSDMVGSLESAIDIFLQRKWEELIPGYKPRRKAYPVSEPKQAISLKEFADLLEAEYKGTRTLFGTPVFYFVHQIVHSVANTIDSQRLCQLMTCGTEKDITELADKIEAQGGGNAESLISEEAYFMLCFMSGREPKKEMKWPVYPKPEVLIFNMDYIRSAITEQLDAEDAMKIIFSLTEENGDTLEELIKLTEEAPDVEYMGLKTKKAYNFACNIVGKEPKDLKGLAEVDLAATS